MEGGGPVPARCWAPGGCCKHFQAGPPRPGAPLRLTRPSHGSKPVPPTSPTASSPSRASLLCRSP